MSFPSITHGSNDVSPCGVTTAENDLKSFVDYFVENRLTKLELLKTLDDLRVQLTWNCMLNWKQ